jgi:hypothetical protein
MSELHKIQRAPADSRRLKLGFRAATLSAINVQPIVITAFREENEKEQRIAAHASPRRDD